MKQIFILFLLIIASSCRTYIDDEKHFLIDNQTIKINRFKNYNELNYHSKIGASADKDFYYPQHFNIHLPKKIKNWSASDKANFIEYDNNRLIVVDAGYINKNIKITTWKSIDDNNKINHYIESYYSLRKKNFNPDKKIKPSNKIKLYTDGKVYILFYKIENTDLYNFEKIVNSFEYID